jgi:hypothetical protein
MIAVAVGGHDPWETPMIQNITLDHRPVQRSERCKWAAVWCFGNAQPDPYRLYLLYLSPAKKRPLQCCGWIVDK